MDNNKITEVANNLRKRAHKARIEGIAYIIIIILISAAITFSFVTHGGSMSNIYVNGAHSTAVIQPYKSNFEVGDVIKDVVLRMGAVAIAIYLIKILVDFARHRFTIAEIFSANADALIISGGDLELFSSFSKSLNPNTGFGKIPDSPYEGIMSITKELVSKIDRVSSK